MKKIRLDITTDTAGAGNATYGTHVQGYLYAVQFIDGDLADGVDVDIDCVNGNLTYVLMDKDDFNTDQIAYPRTLEHLDTDGSDLSTHCLPIVSGKPKATVASGGSVKTGAFLLYIKEWD